MKIIEHKKKYQADIKHCLLVCFFIAMCSFFSHALCAETATMDVSIEKAHAMRVSNLDDFYFADLFILRERVLADDVCMYSSSGQYYVTATGLNDNGGQFRVHDGAGNYMQYRLSWSDQVAANDAFTRLYPNQPRSGVYVNADTANPTCAGNVNASIQVEIVFFQFIFVPQGTYTDVVTFLFEPE